MRREGTAKILIWGGLALLAVGLILSVPRIMLYASTFAYTRTIPTAPALPQSTLPGNASPVLLPFETEAPEAEGIPDVTPTSAESSLTLPTAMPSSTPVPSPTSAPTATPTIVWPGVEPTAIRIPSIALDAPIAPIGWSIVESDGVQQAIWDVPNTRVAGWHNTSARIGVQGNTVLNGHNATKGEVFRDLYKVEVGALIIIDTEDGGTYAYRVGEKYILREAGQPLDVRIENARYIQPTEDERLTLVTCHPYGSLANRLLIIAYPAPQSETVPSRGD